MKRAASLATGVAVTALFAFGLWFRVTSLESMPLLDADEGWYGVQAQHLLAGESFATRTPSANPLNPFFVGMHLPLLLVFEPKLWLLRVPAVICGLVAVVLTYVLGRKILDRGTALIAAALLAVLPIAIIFSRLGFDACQTPLFTLLAVYCAFRAHRLGTVLAFLAGYLVHPTNIFLFPVIWAVYLVQALRQAAGDRARQLRIAAAAVLAPGLIVLGGQLYLKYHPAVRNMYTERIGPGIGHQDWRLFLTLCRRLFLAMTVEVPEAMERRYDRIFWGIVLMVFVLGTWRLVRGRQWDRLALIGGLIASAVGFHLVLGTNAIRPVWVLWLRYGLFLVVPSVLAFACLARSLLVEPTTRGRAVVLFLQQAALLALGVALLITVKVNWFDLFAGCGESPWTFRTDRKDVHQQALSLILHDAKRDGARRWTGADGSQWTVVIADGYWYRSLLLYLTWRRPDIKVVDLYKLGGFDLERCRKQLHKQLLKGAYAYGPVGAGGEIEKTLGSLFPADQIRRWEFRRTRPGVPPPIPTFHVALYRLQTPDEARPPAPMPLATRDHGGRPDPAVPTAR